MASVGEKFTIDSSDDEELRADEHVSISAKDCQKRQLSPLKNGNARQTPAQQRTLARAHDNSLFKPVAIQEPRRKLKARTDFSAEGLSLLTPKPKSRLLKSPSKLLQQPQTDLRQTLRSITLDPKVSNIFEDSEIQTEDELPTDFFTTQVSEEDDMPIKPRSRRAAQAEDDDLAATMQGLGLSESADYSNEPSTPTAVTPTTTPRRALQAVSSQMQNQAAGDAQWKSNLPSPSKQKISIPPKPNHHPSMDEFWSVEEVNNWNDAHSPKKVILSPHKPATETLSSKLLDLSMMSSDDEPDDENDLPSFRRRKASETPKVPTSEPAAQNAASPAKQARAAKLARKAFDEIKEKMAQDFIIELDNAMTNGAISQLAEATGGIQLNWSKTLNTTAGRAHRKLERVNGVIAPTVWIELSDKILTNEYRLRNTLAHEFCHLYVFTIDKIKESHGKHFKAVAARVVAAFAHHDIKVTTRHNYEIDFKYKWQCVGPSSRIAGMDLSGETAAACGQIYGRHSRSIDPARQGCGRCKGHLVQIAPAPRGGGDGDGVASPKKAPNAWQQFVADNIKPVREELGAGVSQKALMAELGVRYRQGVGASAAADKLADSTTLVSTPSPEPPVEDDGEFVSAVDSAPPSE